MQDKIENFFKANENELEQALAVARDISWKHFGKKIRFYAPSFMYYKTNCFCSSPAAFPSISVTGSFCALKCKHCGGKVLNTMMSALRMLSILSCIFDARSLREISIKTVNV